jgi:hypothetical protein
MIKTLKITSLFAVAAAAGFVIFLGVFGLKGDEEIEKFLNSPGVVEIFKKLATKTNESSDQISPLVKQARAFARIINPPAPPKPKPTKSVPKKTAKSKPARPKPKVTVSAKFKLLATCRYETDPAKSMALLDMPAKGPKWFRQGEEVNHLIIEQITDGGIILYKSGKENSRISIPVIEKKSLLKSDLIAHSQPEPAVDLFPVLKEFAPPDEVHKTPETINPLPKQKSKSRTLPRRKTINPLPKQKSKRRTLPRRKTIKVRIAPPKPTLEQRKTAIDNTITNIRKIMTSSTEDGQQTEDTQKTWMAFLKGLETERKGLEKPDTDLEKYLREDGGKTQQDEPEKSETTEPDTNSPQE